MTSPPLKESGTAPPGDGGSARKLRSSPRTSACLTSSRLRAPKQAAAACRGRLDPKASIKAWNDFAEQCRKFENALRAEVGEMSKRELYLTLRETEKLNAGNCSFIIFQLRGVISTLVQLEIRARDKRRRQKLLPLV
jgi:hypothetical protein